MAHESYAPPSADAVRVAVLYTVALNARDLDAMMRLMTEDCVFENTYPAPDGARYEGQAAVRAFWQEFFRGSATAHFEIEEIFGAGDRCVMRWTYEWTEPGGKPGHIRGVDVYRVTAGRVAEKLSYVKG